MTPRMWCCDVLSWSGHTRLRSPVFPWPWSLSSLIPSLPEHRERFLSHSPRWWEKGSGDCHPFSALVEISLPKKNRTLSERTRMKTKPLSEFRGTLYGLQRPSFPMRTTCAPLKLPSSPIFLSSMKTVLSFNHQTKRCHVAPEDTV